MLQLLMLILLIIFCSKYIICTLLFLIKYCETIWRRCSGKGKTILSIISIPSRLISKITRNGAERYLIYRISTIPSNTIRRALYRGLGANLGKKSIIHFRTEIRAPHLLKIGQGTIIGDNAILDAREGLLIGENVNLSSNVSIYTLQHNLRASDFSCTYPSERKMSVEIDNRVWLGANVIVLPGVHIGEGAVCCAGCVVTKSVEPFSVVAGIPAKKVGERPKNLIYEFSGKSPWFY